MAIFSLKARDTRPILEVQLKNPDGSNHDLTGSTAWKLHIQVSPTVVLVRDLTKQGPDADGTLRYSWAATDWDPAVSTDPKLPTPSTPWETVELEMEYKVLGGASSRMTFPNDGYDKLQILGDLAGV